MAKKSGLSIAEMKRENEEAHMPREQLDAGLDAIWDAMRGCIERGLSQEGVMPGGLKVRRRAKALHDRLNEDWRTNQTPLRDSQQPLAKSEPLKWYPANAAERDDAQGEFLVTGQVPGEQAVHTATDIPLSAFGPGALAFTGVIDNTDVFFKLAQAAVKGTTAPADASGAKRPAKSPRK